MLTLIYDLLMRQLLATTVLIVGLAPTFAASTPQADLAVDLRAQDGLLPASIYYNISITNRGPQALTSATVTIQLDSDATGAYGARCTFNALDDTVSCPFGSLASGATISTTGWFFFNPGMPKGPVVTTATRTSSTPPDPFTGNDSDTVTCVYDPILQPLDPPPDMRCQHEMTTSQSDGAVRSPFGIETQADVDAGLVPGPTAVRSRVGDVTGISEASDRLAQTRQEAAQM